MQYAVVQQDSLGYKVYVSQREVRRFARAEQVHSYLGELGARKVFGAVAGEIEGTYLLPPVVETVRW